MELELILTELRPFELLVIFGNLLHCRIGLYNQLLLQFSTDVSQTWQTYCGHIENVYVDLELIWTELRFYELSHVSNFLHCMEIVYSTTRSFQLLFLKLCNRIVDILMMCMWGFDGARINFNRIMAGLLNLVKLCSSFPGAYVSTQLLLRFSVNSLQTLFFRGVHFP